MYEQLGVTDSRVRFGAVDRFVLDRCRFVLDVDGRVVFGDHTLDALTGPRSTRNHA